MKRQLIICSLLVVLVGCRERTVGTSDQGIIEPVIEEETSTTDEITPQLTRINEQIARIEVHLDERLSGIERRLQDIESATSASPPAAAAAATTQNTAVPEPAAATTSVDVEPVVEVGPPDEPAAAENVPVVEVVAQSPHAYVGALQCAPCHLPQFQSWVSTKMAKAYKILKPGERAEAKIEANLDPNKDYTTDETCLPCHVTGYGQKGGFKDAETTPALAGITCEACHGPAGTYIEKGLKKNEQYKKADLVADGLVDQITVKQCENCHNDKSPFVGDDYVFDFEANKEDGTHQHYPLKFKH